VIRYRVCVTKSVRDIVYKTVGPDNSTLILAAVRHSLKSGPTGTKIARFPGNVLGRKFKVYTAKGAYMVHAFYEIDAEDQAVHVVAVEFPGE
jgi:hypothetical protein